MPNGGFGYSEIIGLETLKTPCECLIDFWEPISPDFLGPKIDVSFAFVTQSTSTSHPYSIIKGDELFPVNRTCPLAFTFSASERPLDVRFDHNDRQINWDGTSNRPPCFKV